MKSQDTNPDKKIAAAHQKAYAAILPLLRRSELIGRVTDDRYSFFSHDTLLAHVANMSDAPNLDYLVGYSKALLANIDMHRSGETNIQIGRTQTSLEDTWMQVIHEYVKSFTASLRVPNPLETQERSR